MKLAHLDDRLVLVLDGGVADVATASDGRFGPDPMAAFDDWPAFTAWAAGVDEVTGPLDEAKLRCPVPRPRQVFAIGLNYRSHAEESGMAVPEVPATFTKYPASLAGPFDDIEIVGDTVDWEVELVAVIGRTADRVAEADAWDHVAGLTVGQDISDRTLQFAAGMQFSLGKSRRRTRWPIATTSPSGAPSTARRCRRRARTISCSPSRNSSPSCRRCCPSCRAT